MYDVSAKRGGYSHKKTIQALVALTGSCEVFINNGNNKETIILNKPDQCLILEPKDWHTMDNFSQGTVLLVLSSEYYDKNDYIIKEYK